MDIKFQQALLDVGRSTKLFIFYINVNKVKTFSDHQQGLNCWTVVCYFKCLFSF